jgi:hypothetical protein
VTYRRLGLTDGERTRRPLRRGVRWCLVGAVGLLAPAVLAGPAGATGSYPGETLSIAQSGPAVAGQAVNFLATGQQTDVNDYAGGFSLEVFEKDPTVDPTCAAGYWDETNNEITDPSELHFIIGDWQGTDTTFSVPFKAVFEKPGPVLLCAYSTWITDTAASATLTVNVTSQPATPPTGNVPSLPVTTPTVAKPVNQSPPKVSRLRNKLRCSPGSWSNSPASLSYRWMAGGHQLRGAKQSQLAVSRSLRGHEVRCSVIATNSAGTATALSRPVRVH